MADIMDGSALIGGNGPVHQEPGALLSTLLRVPLVDGKGKKGAIADLMVDVSESNYPPVVELIYRWPGRQERVLSWHEIRLGREPLSLRTSDLDAGRVLAAEDTVQRVLIRRDILDSLVLDLLNCQASRANDLYLAIEDDTLRLAGVDASPWAVLRRLSRGILGKDQVELLDWRRVGYLRGDAQMAHTEGDSHRRMARLPPALLARLSAAVPYPHAVELLTLLPDPVAADTLELLQPERQLQVFEELGIDQAGRILALMAPDAAADLLGAVEPETVRPLLERLPHPQAERIIELLRYPEDTAGGIMTNVVLQAPADWTVAQARHELRQGLQDADFVYHVYAVDDMETGRLEIGRAHV